MLPMSFASRDQVRSNDVIFGIAVLIAAVAAGVAAALTGTEILLAVAAVIIGIMLLPRLRFWILAAGLLIPLSASLTLQAGGNFVPLSDLAAIAALASFALFQRNRPDDDPRAVSRYLINPVKPGLILLGIYVVTAALNAFLAHPELDVWLKLAQRLELVAVWLLVGACLVATNTTRLFLAGFVATSTALALMWIANPGAAGVLGTQKNPGGGFIAASILIVLLSPLASHWRIPLLLVLTGGLIGTGSRGSMVGLAVALLVLIVFVRHWRRVILQLAAICVGAFAALQFLPKSLVDRIAGRTSASSYNADIRDVFVQDALRQWNDAPWTGVGVGQYEQLNSALARISTHDPHNVFVLAFTEGGWPLGVAFLALAGGTLLWLMRKPKTTAVVLALTVQISTLAHAYVDVYWVRGTPAIGWALIGVAAAATYQWQRGRDTEVTSTRNEPVAVSAGMQPAQR